MERKNISEPWLSFIERDDDKRKEYEGRLNRGFWSMLKVSDRFTAFSDKRELLLEVTDLKYYTNASSAWHDLHEKLIPIEMCNSGDQAHNIYNEFWSDDDMLKYGFIAIGVKVIK